MDWFSASTEHPGDIARVMAALSPFGEEAQITLAPDGMLICATDAAASAGASLFLDKATFQDYRPLDVPRALAVNLDALVKIVRIFGGWQDSDSSVCSIMYTMGQPLEFRSSIDQMLAQASVNVIESGDKEVPSIDPQQIVAHAILNGAAMRQLFRHCERARAQDIELVTTTGDSVLELRTYGVLLNSQFVLSDRDSGTLQYLDLPRFGQFKYDFELFARAKTAIARANKASIRIDTHGVLSLQTMHEMGKEQVICDMAFLCKEQEV